ncbi:MAG: VTT domain-containing protein [Anaeromyxobacteraceae bacterium]
MSLPAAPASLPAPSPTPAWRRLVAPVAVTLAVALAARALGLDASLERLAAVARSFGAPGVALHAFLYVPAMLLGLPVAPLTAAAGLAYGPLAGAALAVPASTLASTLAFLAGRRGLGPGALAGGTCLVSRAARAAAAGGVRAVFLLRLVPVAPGALLSFALGATACRTRDFVVGSLLGSVPVALLYAWLGALLGGG